MREPLQELFENELRNYQFYSQKIKELKEEIQILENKQNELEQRQEVEEKTNSLAKELRELQEAGFKFPKKSFDEIIQSLEDFRMLEGEMVRLEYITEKIATLEDIYKIYRLRKEKSMKNLFHYIRLVSEKNIQFIFEKDNQLVRRILILAYQDDYNFKYYRNVIKLDGCKLEKRFLKAYTAETQEEKEKAMEWFKNQAKKLEQIDF